MRLTRMDGGKSTHRLANDADSDRFRQGGAACLSGRKAGHKGQKVKK